ncbi:DnaJ-domain-containing protein [Flagelloscypha sp. PMI_526]|nr:DnaJ-domain-containing protein [Flagelloscypha sp. PMI_526]
MGKDYYKLLGVDKSADEDAIKRAYKKAALKWHPDRNQGSTEASKKFQEISEAFEVLSDKQKRTIYDQFGEEGLKGGGGPSPGAGSAGGFPGFSSGGFPGGSHTFSFSSGGSGGGGFAPTDPNFLFEQIFGSMGGMGGMGGFSSSSRSSARRGFDEDDDDPMSGSNFSFGGMPGGMGGMGGMPNGRSSRSSKAQASAPSQPSEITKPLAVTLNELYSGTTKRLKIGRKMLNGRTEDKVLEINVIPGWKSGTKVRFAKAGNESATGDAQDLVFVVEEKPHDRFTREDNDLVTELPIPLVEALTGSKSTSRSVETLDGRRVTVSVPHGVIKPGQRTTVRGEGMPVRKAGQPASRGDLIVKWKVVFPERLTEAQKEGIRKVLA